MKEIVHTWTLIRLFDIQSLKSETLIHFLDYLPQLGSAKGARYVLYENMYFNENLLKRKHFKSNKIFRILFLMLGFFII